MKAKTENPQKFSKQYSAPPQINHSNLSQQETISSGSDPFFHLNKRFFNEPNIKFDEYKEQIQSKKDELNEMKLSMEDFYEHEFIKHEAKQIYSECKQKIKVSRREQKDQMKKYKEVLNSLKDEIGENNEEIKDFTSKMYVQCHQKLKNANKKLHNLEKIVNDGVQKPLQNLDPFSDQQQDISSDESHEQDSDIATQQFLTKQNTQTLLRTLKEQQKQHLKEQKQFRLQLKKEQLQFSNIRNKFANRIKLIKQQRLAFENQMIEGLQEVMTKIEYYHHNEHHLS